MHRRRGRRRRDHPAHPAPGHEAPPRPRVALRRTARHADNWTPAADYESQRAEAERRIAARDPDDWPTVALALTLGLPVWSQDKDLTIAGLDVHTTGELLDALRDAGHIE